MAWVNPTSETLNGWSGAGLAWNDSTADYSSFSCGGSSWSDFLEMYRAAIQCDSVRVYVSGQTADIDAIHVQVYYDSQWNTIYNGAVTLDQYTTYPIGSTETVTGVQVQLYNSKAQSRNAYIHDTDFNEVEGTLDWDSDTDSSLVSVSEQVEGYLTKLFRELIDNVEVTDDVTRDLEAPPPIDKDIYDLVSVEDYVDKFLTKLFAEVVDLVEEQETTDRLISGLLGSAVTSIEVLDYEEHFLTKLFQELYSLVYTTEDVTPVVGAEPPIDKEIWDVVDIPEYIDHTYLALLLEVSDNVEAQSYTDELISALLSSIYDEINVLEDVTPDLVTEGAISKLVTDLVEIVEEVTPTYLAIEKSLQDLVEVLEQIEVSGLEPEFLWVALLDYVWETETTESTMYPLGRMVYDILTEHEVVTPQRVIDFLEISLYEVINMRAGFHMKDEIEVETSIDKHLLLAQAVSTMVNAIDSIEIELLIQKTLHDVVELAELFMGTPSAILMSLTDIVEIETQLEKKLDMVSTLYDLVSVSESLSQYIPILYKAMQDIVSILESVDRGKEIGQALVELIDASDEVYEYIGLNMLLQDDVFLSEWGKLRPFIGKLLYDLVSSSDFKEVKLDLMPVIFDDVEIAELVSTWSNMLNSTLSDTVDVTDWVNYGAYLLGYILRLNLSTKSYYDMDVYCKPYYDMEIDFRPYYDMEIYCKPYYDMVVYFKPYYNLEIAIGGEHG